MAESAIIEVKRTSLKGKFNTVNNLTFRQINIGSIRTTGNNKLSGVLKISTTSQ